MENRLPAWFKQDLISTQALEFSRALRNKFRLNTVCHSAKCPNMPHCFSRHHATFMILGDSCTRQCKFCNVKKHSRQELTLDLNEPCRIAEAVKSFNLEYAVITSVTRDDLADGGAGHFVKTIKAIRELSPDTEIEVLIPDFNGSLKALEVIVKEKPEVISHNLETVENIFPLVRNVADYKRSLDLIKNIKLINPGQATKSSIMLGLGETDSDLEKTLRDLRSANCDMLVLGQYLSPSREHYPVQKFYAPDEFKYWEKFAYNLGFINVLAFPLARTSYLVREKNNV